MSLEEIPGAIRYEDPMTETAGSGLDPGIEMWISRSDRLRFRSDAPASNVDDDPSVDSEEELVDEPAVIFEIPPEVTVDDVRNRLGKNRLEKIEQLSQIRGMDAYGWYTTFHQNRVQHGVHIPFEGILAFVVHALLDVDVPLERKLQLAFHAILRHELFHFDVDCMTANWEMATGSAVYWRGQDRYRKPLRYVQLEEALANATCSVASRTRPAYCRTRVERTRR